MSTVYITLIVPFFLAGLALAVLNRALNRENQRYHKRLQDLADQRADLIAENRELKKMLGV